MAFKRCTAFTIVELLMVTLIAAVLAALAIAFLNSRRKVIHHTNYSQVRQIALAGIMYSSDYDDTLIVTINGPLSRMQDVADGHFTVACPAKGTQSTSAPDAAGGQRTDAWPLLLMPYIKSRGLYTADGREDASGIWRTAPKTPSDTDYDSNGPTYRNQNMFPMYGYNYMFCAPLRIPTSKRSSANPANYAVSEPLKYVDADDPSGTVCFVESQYSVPDTSHGFYVVNAPGMWDAFKNNNHGLMGYWMGGAGSGDWVGTKTACEDASVPCKDSQSSSGFVSGFYGGGANTAFLDGHMMYMKLTALAAGTDYATASAKADGSGAHISDKAHYLWNLTKDYHGL